MITRIEGEILNSNVYVVSNGKECFIVDAGVPVEIVKKYVENQKILAVFLTHGHYDHIYFLNEYLHSFDCEFYASEFSKEYIEDSNKNLSKESVYDEIEVKDTQKIKFLCGDGRVDIGDFQIKFFQLGGHSKGDMMFDYEGNIFVGDLVIGRDVGRYDMFGGDKKVIVKSLDFLEHYDYQIMFSGHGKENPKSVQDKVVKLWKKFLDR